MIWGLIAQLYQKHTDSQKHLDRLYPGCNNGGDQPQDQALVAALYHMIGEARDLTIVLDALDECKGRKDLLAWSTETMAILMTSRKEQDFQSSLTGCMPTDAIVPIDQSAVNADILCVIKSRLAQREGFQRWESRPEVYEEIMEKLMEKADGMFRWAACQLIILEDCLDLPSLHRALSSLPTDLNETYERMLSRIPHGYRRDATRLLQFLVYSERPLRLEEAVDLIDVHPELDPPFGEQYRMPRPEEISRFCPSLVDISEETDQKSSAKVSMLRLAHMSVREYLTSTEIQQNFRADLEEITARTSMVEISLLYLTDASCLDNAEMVAQIYL